MKYSEMSEENREHRRAYMRKYREEHLEHVRAVNRQYYWKNRKKMLAYGKAYREEKRVNLTEKDIEERREYQRLMYRIYKEQKNNKAE